MVTRTQHAKRNIITSVINKLVSMLATFIMRTVIIRYLGSVYLGLDSLFVSLLSILSLAELGVGSAMVFSMYKPIAENDTPAVCALLKLYRTIYRWIAVAMTVIGLAIVPFLPIIVKSEMPEGMNLYILYLINLSSTVLSYLLFAYRGSLFTATQHFSVNNNIFTYFKIGSAVAQSVAVIVFRNYYYYTLVLPLTEILKNYVIYIISNRMYPQYQCEGTVPKEEIDNIKKRVAGMFLYRLSHVFSNSLDSIVLSAFLGLTVLAKYNNYYYVLNAVVGILSLVSTSLTASVGNSIVLESQEKNYADFNKLQVLYMWLTAWCTMCLLCCYQPFVKLWVGEEMLFGDGIMVIFCIYFFSRNLNSICYIYRQAAGLWWQDRFRPVAETITNFVLNIVLVKIIGMTGVMFSTLFCIIFIDCVWGSRTLFKYYFTHAKMSVFILKLLFFAVLTTVSGVICYYVCLWLNFDGIIAIVVNLAVATVVLNVVFVAGSSFLPEFKPAIGFLKRAIK
ncbi:MAG: oligosaccharide flippase family protein [Clostridia bacterium]|nr:oligosaccharide flippase family protein [Clostridia bacterium]